MKVWDTQTGRETLTLTGHTGRVQSVAFSPDGRRVATASMDGAARIWRLVPEGRSLADLTRLARRLSEVRNGASEGP